MKVLLLSVNTEQINMPVLPLGLACVAAAAERAGHEVELLNLRGDQHNHHAALEAACKRFAPRVIGISVRNIDDQTMHYPKFLLGPVKRVVEQCRSPSPAPIVLGGAGFSIFPEQVLSYLGADMGIAGEGEAAFVSLLERIERNTDPGLLPGMVLPGRAGHSSPQWSRSLDRFSLPLPHVHLGSPDDGGDPSVWLPFQTRRGCPMACSYCSTSAIEGTLIRKRSPALVVESIGRFVAVGLNQFFFVDNTFNLPPSYAQELCDKLAAAPFDIAWRCILYPWKVDEQLVEKMARAGCREVSLGFESGSKPVLRALNKRFEPGEVRRIAKLLKRYGIHCMGFLLLGGPGETRETVRESLAFADSLDLDAMKVSVGIRIYPHTALARIAVRDGIVETGDDLLQPKFYLTPQLEEWLRSTVAAWFDQRPHWHG